MTCITLYFNHHINKLKTRLESVHDIAFVLRPALSRNSEEFARLNKDLLRIQRHISGAIPRGRQYCEKVTTIGEPLVFDPLDYVSDEEYGSTR